MGRLNKKHTPIEGVVEQTTGSTRKRSARKGKDISDAANGHASGTAREVNDTANDTANNNVTTVIPPPSRLTRKNLARLDKLLNVAKIGPRNENRSTKYTLAADQLSTGSVVSDGTTTTMALSATAPGFDRVAMKNGILDVAASRPPANLDALRQRLNQARGSEPPPPESVYTEYAYNVRFADNEATVMRKMHRLLQDYPLPYKDAVNQAWNAMPKDAGFNNGLSAPQPYYVQGLEESAFWPLLIFQLIPGAVLFKDQIRGLALPHITGEFKDPSGNMRVAATQSSYAGAAMVFARDQALAYAGQPDPMGHAAVWTFTTNGNQLNIYTHYSSPSHGFGGIGTDKGENNGQGVDYVHAGDGREYHQYLVQSTSLTDSYETFKASWRALYNLQDHAREQAYALRDQLMRPGGREQPEPADTHADQAGTPVGKQDTQPGPSAVGKGRKRKASDVDASGLPRHRSKRLMGYAINGEDEE